MSYAEFERVNEEADGIYENPRNLATANVQMLSANESRKRESQFFAFNLVELEAIPQFAELDKTGYFMEMEDDRFRFLENLGSPGA